MTRPEVIRKRSVTRTGWLEALLIRGSEKIRQKAEMAVELEDLLNAGRVDLITLGDADPFLSVNVIRGERLFCSDHYAADEYELYILRRAGDLADFERERIERIMHLE
jgi:hypothetical protein